jgi:quinol monooxygenase YgiN
MFAAVEGSGFRGSNLLVEALRATVSAHPSGVKLNFHGCKGEDMVKYALYGSLKAKPGKEAEVEAFLKQGAELARKEKGTATWYAIREDHGQYGIFDTFEEEAGREAHLNGEIAKALMARAAELFAEPPQIHKIAVIAVK